MKKKLIEHINSLKFQFKFFGKFWKSSLKHFWEVGSRKIQIRYRLELPYDCDLQNSEG